MITFARLTLVEAARRRILWALVALTIAVAILTGWGLGLLTSVARERGTPESQVTLGISQLVILVAFMFSFVLTMTATFLAAPAVGGQIESGIALAVLARPVRRSTYLLGTWLGLGLLVTAYAVGAGLIELGVVRLVTGYVPPDPLGAGLYLAAEALVLMTLALVLGTRLPGIAAGAIAVVVFGLTWVAGVLGGVGVLFDSPALVNVSDASRVLVPVDGLWRGVVWSLEPGELLLFSIGRGAAFEANPFFANHAPDPAFLAWSAAWMIAVLAVGVVALARREP